MTDRIEEMLVRTLHERSELEVEPVGLAGAARRRARAIRQRRLGAAAAAVAVVTAVAVAVPSRSADRAEGPPAGQGREVTLSPSAAVRTTVTLRELAAGAPPEVGWREGDTFHHSGGHDVELPVGTSEVAEKGESTVAVVAAVHPSLRVLDASGTSGTPVTGDRPVTDGAGRIAYVDHEKAAVVVLSPQGETAWSYDVPDPSRAAPVGFLDTDRVLVALLPRTSGSRPRYVVAGPEGGRPWQSAMTVQVVGSRALGGVGPGSADVPCLTVQSSRTGAPDWRACPPAGQRAGLGYRTATDLSPTDRWLVALGRELPGAGGTDRGVVLDTRTGEAARELVAAPGAVIGQAVAETDDAVLLAVWEDGRAGLVRCTIDGACETAAPSRSVALADWVRAPMATG